MPEQEDRLLRYCEYHDIEVKGIFHEDFSAKTFNRPKWKKLLEDLKKNSSRGSKNVLFVKWDRFSRNIENAYEMIRTLRKYQTTAMAIDQPIDLSIPESSVMLAVYLSVPEAENIRRALNTANGMRRAKEMGRYPNSEKLEQLVLSGKTVELFGLILKDSNINTQMHTYSLERNALQKQLDEQTSIISKARRLFVADRLKFDDFSELKKEYQSVSDVLRTELHTVSTKLKRISTQAKLAAPPSVDVFSGFQDIELANKKQIISLLPPAGIDRHTGNVTLLLSDALLKILSFKKKSFYVKADLSVQSSGDFTSQGTILAGKKVSPLRAISILAKNNVEVNEKEAVIILNIFT